MKDAVAVPPKMHAGDDGGDGAADVRSVPPPRAPRPRWRSPFLAIVLRLVVFVFWNLLSVGVLFLPLPAPPIAALELAIVAVFARRYLLPRRRRSARGELARRAVLRLRAVPREAWGIVAAWIGATLVLDNLVTMVSFHLVPRAADYPDPFVHLLARPLGWLPVVVTTVLAAPLVEEVAFRGWVQRPLERRVGAAWAIAVTALLFALAHGLELLIPYYFVAGLALGASVYLTRSLWVGIAAHAAHNAWSVLSDEIGLTNERMIAWTARPAVFWLAVAALAGWVLVMIWLGRRMRAASRGSRGARSPDLSPISTAHS